MIIIFLGPPYCGKGTQSEILAKQFNIPVFSMGALIREGYENKDPKAIEGFENYSMKGLHLPNSLKFHLLKNKMEQNPDGFILDNYPATQEDLQTIYKYLDEKSFKIDKVIYLPISVEEMKKRLSERGRRDDDLDILLKRREQQDKDRNPVLNFFSSKGLLVEISGEGSVDEIHNKIMEALKW